MYYLPAKTFITWSYSLFSKVRVGITAKAVFLEKQQLIFVKNRQVNVFACGTHIAIDFQ